MECKSESQKVKGVKTLIVTSCGGPCAMNAIQCLRAGEQMFIVGTDSNPYMVQLGGGDVNVVVHHSSEATEMYAKDICSLAKKYNASMLVPISDREIYVASLNKNRLPPLTLPSLQLMSVTRDKGALYSFMRDRGFETPPFKITKKPCYVEFSPPYWVRATIGAGGYLSRKADSLPDLKLWIRLNRNKNRDFLISKYLEGRNFCWTSLWNQGELVFCATKQRLQWLYNRIGTTAVQKIVHENKVTELCEKVIKALSDVYDENLTGLMMVDLKEDLETGSIFVTEVNAGRTGTVSYWFALMSKEEYGDQRANFWYQLVRIHHGERLMPVRKYDPFSEGYVYLRHVDMGYKLMKERKWRVKK